MSIQSLEFFGFAAAVLVLYYLAPRQKQNLLLLLASYIFYITISWHFALVLSLMTLGNYLTGRKIESRVQHRAKSWLLLGIGFNLVIWLFFKGADFFVPQVLALISRLGLPIRSEGLKILLPIGLSFYTLQAISYLVDTYRGQLSASPPLVDFALYLAYFPRLTAGPIERPRPFLLQLARQRTVDNDLLARSFTLLVIGLVRKVVIADALLQAVPAKIFETPLEFSAIQLAAWLLAYAFGVYNDFCGYTNIVRGVSGFFGITLSRNFAIPFFSRNFTEFWNRWHITLSLWLRDYVYFPISRALVRRRPGLKNPANIILPPLLTMLASGLWHGPRLSYLTWGALMGLYLVGENITASLKPILAPDKKPSWKQWLAAVKIILFVLAALILFLMKFSTALQFFQGLLTNTQWILPNSRVFLMMIPSLWLDFVQYRRKDEFAFLSWPLLSRAALLALAGLAIFLFSQSKIPPPFIYQGF